VPADTVCESNVSPDINSAVTRNAVKIKVANAPCSWGALEFDLDGQAPEFERVLSEMAQAGYTGTELGDWGFMPTDPSTLQESLQQRSLSMLGAFVPVNLRDRAAHDEGTIRAIRTAQLLAEVGQSPVIVLADDNGTNPARTKNAGRIKAEHRLEEEQWQIFVHGAQRIAMEVLEQTGVRTVFHHHCAGFVETPEEVERFLSETDAELVGLCFDTGHYTFGGGNAFDGLKKHASRIKHVHFKDCDLSIAAKARALNWDYFESVKNGIFCELGNGAVPFEQIVQELKRQNYSGWVVVEQDVLPGMGSPFQSAVRNRQYLNQIGL
jgi:inosose dehydratase